MTVSTHVLDASAGRPAEGVAVSLSYLDPAGGWVLVASGETGADGRHRFAAATERGQYRLTFGTGRYFADRGAQTFYPEVTITFSVTSDAADAADAGAHYHVPLLLSPFGYSTYRGS